MLSHLASAASAAPHAPQTPPPPSGCSWWNLVCQGGHAVASSGMEALTKSIASGAAMLLDQITRVIDGSTQVPLADPTYRHIYYGFLGLAVPLIAAVLLGALVVASIRRDPATFGRAVTGVVVATLGGALYITFAQMLVAADEWLSHGIVRVTGHNLGDAMTQLAGDFHRIAGAPGDMAANMLLIILMLIMIIAGLGLWFVLVLRKMAILVVVVFAPLLIAGWLWKPTRAWVRRATEVLVALVFTKSAIYALFGIGLSLLFRDHGQSLSDFVGAVILLCGACFAPLMMLKLVHFAADSHVAGEMMGTLGAGAATAANRGRSAGRAVGQPMGRHQMARDYAGSNQPGPQPTVTAGTTSPGGSPSATPGAGTTGAAAAPSSGVGAGAGGAAAGGGAGGAGASASGIGGAGAAAGAGAGLVAAGVAAAQSAGTNGAASMGSLSDTSASASTMSTQRPQDIASHEGPVIAGPTSPTDPTEGAPT